MQIWQIIVSKSESRSVKKFTPINKLMICKNKEMQYY